MLQTFRDALTYIGYGSDLIRADYEYATLNKTRSADVIEGTSKIEMAAFSRYPPTYQDACIGITFTNGFRGRENILHHQYLGAPLIFEVDRDAKSVRAWSIHSDGPKELQAAFPINRVAEVFARREHSWGLDAMRALKRSGANALQADFFDALRLPRLDEEFQKSLRHLLEGVVDKIQKTYLLRFNSAPPINFLFPYLFRFMTAKVFLDRQDVEGWSTNFSPLELYKKADIHLAAKRAAPIPDEFFDSELLDAVWRAFGSGLCFQNISAAALAYIYESCFIDKATRVQLSIHSTPPQLVDFIINQLPIDKLADSGRKVMEPFCGSGVFLAAAMRRLGELNEHNLLGPKARHDYFKKRLVGIESEPLAMEVCQLRLTLSDYPMGNGWNLFPQDVFMWPEWDQELKSTDILLANPPFHSIPRDKRDTYQATKAVMPAEMLYRVMKRPPALMGLVLPPSFLTGPDYREANRALANAYRRVDYVELPENVFTYATRETVVVLCSDRRNQSNEPPANRQVTVTAKQVSKHTLGSFYQSGHALWTRTQVKTFNPEQQALPLRVDPPADIWELLNDAPKLNEIADIHMGIHWKPRSDGLKKTAPRTDVVSNIVREGFHRGCENMRGCLFPFSLCSPKYLSRREEDQDPANKAWRLPWEQPKVVCNRHRFQPGSPWRLVACADTEGLAFSQAYVAVWPTVSNISLFALTAVLCSPLANAYLFDCTPGPDNHVSKIRTVPLPPIAALASGGEIDRMAGALHAFRKENMEHELLQERLAVFDEMLIRMDATVLEAYGLPAEHERKLLDRFNAKKQQVARGVQARGGYIKSTFKEAVSLRDYLAITLDWEATNKRRGELIDKEYTAELNDAETAELDHLQILADQFINLEGIYQDLGASSLIAALKQKGIWKD